MIIRASDVCGSFLLVILRLQQWTSVRLHVVVVTGSWVYSLTQTSKPFLEKLTSCCETNSHGLISYRFWCYMAAVFFSPSSPHWLRILFLGCVWSRRVANECLAYPGAHTCVWWYIFSSHWCLLWPARFQKTSLHHSISGILCISLAHVLQHVDCFDSPYSFADFSATENTSVSCIILKYVFMAMAYVG